MGKQQLTSCMFSLTRRAGMTRWTELFPPMTPEIKVISKLALHWNLILILAGGVYGR